MLLRRRNARTLVLARWSRCLSATSLAFPLFHTRPHRVSGRRLDSLAAWIQKTGRTLDRPILDFVGNISLVVAAYVALGAFAEPVRRVTKPRATQIRPSAVEWTKNPRGSGCHKIVFGPCLWAQALALEFDPDLGWQIAPITLKILDNFALDVARSRFQYIIQKFTPPGSPSSEFTREYNALHHCHGDLPCSDA